MKAMKRLPFSLKQRIMKGYFNSGIQKFKVFTFHQIYDENSEFVDDENACRADKFYKFCDVNTFVSMDDAAQKIKNADLSKGDVITFDDCHESVYTKAWVKLRDSKIPFCIFICLEFLDKKGYLSTVQIQEMLSSGLCTLGSHGINHSLYRSLSDDMIIGNCTQSKITLKQLFYADVDYFAYPYGSVYAVDKRSLKYAKQAGYTLAFGTINSGINIRSSKELHYLPRIHMNDVSIEQYWGCK